MADFETPEVADYQKVPAVSPGAMAHMKTFPAAPEHQEALGFPGELVEGWQERYSGY